MNWRDGGGMRLTSTGFQALSGLDTDYVIFDLPPMEAMKLGNLMIMDRKLDCPYYLVPGRQPQLVLFGREQATMFALYGNVTKWLEYLNRT